MSLILRCFTRHLMLFVTQSEALLHTIFPNEYIYFWYTIFSIQKLHINNFYKQNHVSFSYYFINIWISTSIRMGWVAWNSPSEYLIAKSKSLWISSPIVANGSFVPNPLNASICPPNHSPLIAPQVVKCAITNH